MVMAVGFYNFVDELSSNEFLALPPSLWVSVLDYPVYRFLLEGCGFVDVFMDFVGF
jgi:hypothetical protein